MGLLKCVIPGVNLKVFGRAIQSLSKIGDELYIEPLEEGLFLRSVNSTRSAYACFQFTPSFFIDFIDNDDDDNEKDRLRCKLGMKSVLTVFRNLSTIDKTVERCKISWQTKETKMVFQLYCRHGIVKTHNLFFMESETLQAVFHKDLTPNKLTAEPKLLCDAVLNFQANQEEVTLIVRPDFVALKNYVEDESNQSRVIHTELTLVPDEFDHFQVSVDTNITFCLKEFRAVLAFADVTNLPLSLHFEGAGRPLTFAITSDLSFVADFVLATLADDGSDEPDESTQSAEHRSKNPSRFNFERPASNAPRKGNSKSKGMSMSATLRKDRDEEDGDMDLVMMDIQDASMAEPHSSNHRNTHTQHSTRGGSLNLNSQKQQHNSNHAVPSHSEAEARNVSSSNRQTPSVSTVNERLLPPSSSSSSSQRVMGLTSDHNGLRAAKSNPKGPENCDGNDSSQVASNAGRLQPDQSQKSQDEDDLSPVISFIGNANTSTSQPLINSFTNWGEERDEEEDDDESEDDERIRGTPPNKKFRSLFFGTQSSTQSSMPTQEHVTVLAPDSDCDD